MTNRKRIAEALNVIYQTENADAARCLQFKTGQTGQQEREVFGCLFNTRHRLNRDEELIYGFVDRAADHSRVILQKALKRNASALIWYPSSARS
ncbi:MAG: hypothetical protein OXC69_07455 [Candidatus Tectomicrobia bacterium]|nr:hypothetical protein [Candidatus Tectomicrobia bacterium]